MFLGFEKRKPGLKTSLQLCYSAYISQCSDRARNEGQNMTAWLSVCLARWPGNIRLGEASISEPFSDYIYYPTGRMTEQRSMTIHVKKTAPS